VHFLAAGGDAFRAVNHVDIDAYLAGVLPRELYPAWSPATYRAQAIAARTFVLYHKLAAGDRRDYDVGRSASWQKYGGSTAETDKAWAAVRSTRGQYLACGPEGGERIFLAQYSACNGGHVNGAYVIRDAPRTGPLAGGQADGDGRRCPRYRWGPVRIAKRDIYEALRRRYAVAEALGGVTAVRVASRTSYGRPIWVDVIGRRGRPLRIRAEDLRLALLAARHDVPAAARLYSMNCKLRDLGDCIEFYDGRGWGHGVGLSQWGAEDKAARGMTAEQILRFYYPGATIFRAY
jgi:stage II sporulation protein D